MINQDHSGSGDNIGRDKIINIFNPSNVSAQDDSQVNFDNLPRSGIPQFVGREKALKKLHKQLQESEDSLIIFDDVREYEQIYDFLPPQEKHFKVIITTRKQDLADSIKVFALEVLDEKPSLDLLISFITDTIDGEQKGIESFTYDELNRVITLTQTGNGVTDKRVDYSYDAASQRTNLKRYGDLSGTDLITETVYRYDEAGRLTQLIHQQGGYGRSAFEGLDQCSCF